MEAEVKELCRRVKTGDRHAAAALLHLSYRPIFSFLRRLCSDDQDAADLTQETFAKGWASLATFNGRSRFTTWIHSIAYRAYVDWRRRNSRNEPKSDNWWQTCVDDQPGPFESAAERQLAQHLYELVDQLDEDKKLAVHLHYYQGLSLRETARVLNVSSSTVKYRLREVVKRLRAELETGENPPLRRGTFSRAQGELS